MAAKTNLAKLEERAEKLLKPKGLPVAFKLLKKGEAKKYKVPALEKNLALCQLFKYCAVFGKARSVTFDNIDSCVVGSYVLGFGQPPSDIMDRWIKGFGYTKKRFCDLVRNIEAVSQGKYESAIFGPLSEFGKLSIKPDGVILLVNSTQAYLLTVGLFDATGKKTVSSFNGHAACEIVAAVEKGKTPWVTIPCGGARGIAESQDDELWVAMTPKELLQTLDRLDSIGLKYPPFVYEMITADLNRDHPLTDLIAREGK
jgi:uncharacterized protein (DUF169 family)